MATSTRDTTNDDGVKMALYYSEPLLSRKDERELFAAYAVTREGSPARAILADKLFRANTRLARDWAHKYWVQAGPKVRQSLDEDDLEQEALCGLWVAIDKYDVSHGEKFSTYATFWIRQRIHRHLDNMGHTIKIPVWRLQQERREKKVASEAQSVTGEKAVYVPLPRTISLDAPLDPYGDNPEDSTLAARLEDTVAETHEEATLDRLSDHAALYLALGYLDLRERYVIELRFGLSGGSAGDGTSEGMTLEAIGALMHVTRERVRQIEARALRVLRTCLRATPEGDVLVSQLLEWRLALIRRNHAHARPRGITPIQPIPASHPIAVATRKKATA